MLFMIEGNFKPTATNPVDSLEKLDNLLIQPQARPALDSALLYRILRVMREDKTRTRQPLTNTTASRPTLEN